MCLCQLVPVDRFSGYKTASYRTSGQNSAREVVLPLPSMFESNRSQVDRLASGPQLICKIFRVLQLVVARVTSVPHSTVFSLVVLNRALTVS